MVQKRGQPASKNKYIALTNEHKLYNNIHGIAAKYQLLNYILHFVQYWKVHGQKDYKKEKGLLF